MIPTSQKKEVIKMKKETAWKYYRAMEGASQYICGFDRKGIVYMTTVTRFPSAWVTWEKASRGQGMGLRFKPKAKACDELIATGKAIAIGTVEDLTALSQYNKGENFEAMIYKYYGRNDWHKENAKFTDCGDIAIDGVEVQVKYYGATFSNEKTLRKARAER